MENKAFFVVSRDCNSWTNEVVCESDLLRWGYSIGVARVHGDNGLYLGGNHFGYLFHAREEVNNFVKTFAPRAGAVPPEAVAWWHA